MSEEFDGVYCLVGSTVLACNNCSKCLVSNDVSAVRVDCRCHGLYCLECVEFIRTEASMKGLLPFCESCDEVFQHFTTDYTVLTLRDCVETHALCGEQLPKGLLGLHLDECVYCLRMKNANLLDEVKDLKRQAEHSSAAISSLEKEVQSLKRRRVDGCGASGSSMETEYVPTSPAFSPTSPPYAPASPQGSLKSTN